MCIRWVSDYCRQKAGIWGFRSDRNEVVDGHDSKVVCAVIVIILLLISFCIPGVLS